ncbi:hypothetical protein DVH24_012767 [Malus domestica]|uniref:PLD phosphodiesterase domain-containing protein n=1 Tax=Malus domestica TaxID=3750 RepID=A0A498HW03_MALDO|nr:hypothetical protein DVH24_012767 [Malus domestica]
MKVDRSHRRITAAAVISLVLLLSLSLLPATESSSQCKAWLVQSIPTDMPALHRVPGVLSTADVLEWLAKNSTERLDVIAQYWQLIAQPEDPRSGDFGYSKEDLQRFGAQEGASVYGAIDDAANRNVSIRLLSHSGVYPDYTTEPSNLASGRPNVKNVTLLFSKWWGSGVVHAKVWISDRRDVYIGSANNDWKSLTQVKELGIYLVGCPKIARNVETYFENLWTLASLDPTTHTTTVSDKQWQVNRQVPCWSHFLDSKARCSSPLPRSVETHHVAGYPILNDPYMFKLPLQTPGYNASSLQPQSSYLSFAPPELTFGRYQADEQAWIETIHSVRSGGTVRISTMDWLGQSQYTKPTVYWSSLSSAISEVVFSKKATVKILVAYWAHFINGTDQYLKSLLYSNVLCSSSTYNHCAGKVEIKYYVVPGFNLTGPATANGTDTRNIYPGYTRVNHGKYAVSDVRAHIGTSNLIWDYFYTTAGVSFGTYNPAIVSQLQEVFNADWDSPYAVPVEELGEAFSAQPSYAQYDDVQDLAARLKRLYESWEDNPDIGFVLMKGSGRAFCSGADAVSLYELVNEGDVDECKKFFETLYKFVYIQGTYLKPHVAIMYGTTMGAGAGIAIPGMFWVVTDKTIFSNPEAQIAFHPDAGASFYLSRLPGYLGIIYFVHLRGEYLALTGDKFNGIREGRFQPLDQCLAREYRTSLAAISNLVSSDFSEWNPRSFKDVSKDMVDCYFSPLPEVEPEPELPTAMREPFMQETDSPKK